MFSNFIYDFVKVTAALPGLIWFRPKWVYENERARKRIRGGALLIANHYGFFDPIHLMMAVWYRRHRFICRKEFFESRAAWLFRGFHCIPIDKENFSVDSFREITGQLSAGALVSMFPEGQVARQEGIAAFKSGMVLMAIKGGAPIVPVYLKPRKHFYSRQVLAIGEPVDVRALCGPRPGMAQIESAAELLHRKEEALRAMTE